ncbi:hypothetical protein HanRHA438_Chr03g0107571 [Helianthus annuus]|nr:hypothetical protein HanIR_Chr03g0105341 [Helianthus annuus]KAJ0934449.1 hypothetical protein HanRHA438_Chr03g0107571 [Helianthus annuus]
MKRKRLNFKNVKGNIPFAFNARDVTAETCYLCANQSLPACNRRFIDSYHARVGLHAPDNGRPISCYYSVINASGSGAVAVTSPFHQPNPTNFHQLPQRYTRLHYTSNNRTPFPLPFAVHVKR